MLKVLHSACNRIAERHSRHVPQHLARLVAAEGALTSDDLDSEHREVGRQLLDRGEQGPDDVLEKHREEQDEAVRQLDAGSTIAEALEEVACEAPERDGLLVCDEKCLASQL